MYSLVLEYAFTHYLQPIWVLEEGRIPHDLEETLFLMGYTIYFVMVGKGETIPHLMQVVHQFVGSFLFVASHTSILTECTVQIYTHVH